MANMNGCVRAFGPFLLCALMAVAAEAQTFQSLASFDKKNGAYPYYVSLIQGPDGNYYGTTLGGGRSGDGAVFRITSAGNVDDYSFCSLPDCGDGLNPMAGLLLATDGNFYGTTAYGGTNGSGTIFKVAPTGKLTTLYNFCAKPNCADGYAPETALVQATDGNLYGTTLAGGSTGCSGYGCGTVFKIAPSGALTTLYSFCAQSGCPDGEDPHGALVQATDGEFYGTTLFGGNNNCRDGCGTVFRITPAGKLTTIYSFCPESACTDGISPFEGLIQANDGNLYGTTQYGGNLSCNNNTIWPGCGTAFRLTRQGALWTLYSFCSQLNCTDGSIPLGGLVQGTDNNFYGSTQSGGINNCTDGCGTLFEITSSGVLTTLYSFCAQSPCVDGDYPEGGLLQATDGVFYGTTTVGGADGVGTVFSLSMGLGPFVTFVRDAGKVGQTGGILGQGFIGTTSVKVNGVPANFTVVSDTFIKATIPPGATTGYVTVTTPTGVLTSNVPFHVIP